MRSRAPRHLRAGIPFQRERAKETVAVRRDEVSGRHVRLSSVDAASIAKPVATAAFASEIVVGVQRDGGVGVEALER
jgi:hypothetical protein